MLLIPGICCFPSLWTRAKREWPHLACAKQQQQPMRVQLLQLLMQMQLLRLLPMQMQLLQLPMCCSVRLSPLHSNAPVGYWIPSVGGRTKRFWSENLQVKDALQISTSLISTPCEIYRHIDTLRNSSKFSIFYFFLIFPYLVLSF